MHVVSRNSIQNSLFGLPNFKLTSSNHSMRNPCSICDAKCCKSYIITVTAFDVLRIVKNAKKPPSDFAVLQEARLLSYDPDTTLDIDGENWPHLLTLKSHPCVFLGKDNLCTIHEFAPLSCRRYPYTLTDKLNTRFCPFPSQLIFALKGSDVGKEPLLNEIELYKKIVKEWNKKPGKKEECVAFLLSKSYLPA